VPSPIRSLATSTGFIIPACSMIGSYSVSKGLWFHSEGLSFPHECPNGQILWVKPTYIAVHSVLSNPVYAGAYAYGKSRCERYVDETGRVRK
jgi:hypothetical protein